MLGFSVETLKTKEIINTEVEQLKCDLITQQEKIMSYFVKYLS